MIKGIKRWNNSDYVLEEKKWVGHPVICKEENNMAHEEAGVLKSNWSRDKIAVISPTRASWRMRGSWDWLMALNSTHEQ